jgi:hypothetical protein
MMALLPVAAVLSLTLWICLTFLFPLGPAGSAVHLLLGLAGALFVRWWGLRIAGDGRRETGDGNRVRSDK